jgi:hypothetical protein
MITLFLYVKKDKNGNNAISYLNKERSAVSKSSVSFVVAVVLIVLVGTPIYHVSTIDGSETVNTGTSSYSSNYTGNITSSVVANSASVYSSSNASSTPSTSSTT